MGFSETVKQAAKEKAHYSCCWCQRRDLFLEVHHILPQAEDGEDTIDNAAPLCPLCHEAVGGNAGRRKQLRERRDWWWSRCEKVETQPDFGPLYAEIRPALKKVDQLLEGVHAGQEDLRYLKDAVTELQRIQIGQVFAATTVEQVAFATGSVSGGGRLIGIGAHGTGTYLPPSESDDDNEKPPPE